MSTEGTQQPGEAGGWLAAAVALANVPTLACVLVHLTGERRWIAGRYVPTRVRGLDDNDSGGLPDEVQSELRHAALQALNAWYGGRAPVLPNPSDALLVEMMSISLGETVPAEYAPMIRGELALPSEEAETSGTPETHASRAAGLWVDSGEPNDHGKSRDPGLRPGDGLPGHTRVPEDGGLPLGRELEQDGGLPQDPGSQQGGEIARHGVPRSEGPPPGAAVSQDQEAPRGEGPPPGAAAPQDQAAPRGEGPPPGFRALIIGAGISGLCAAVEFAKAGIPYVILERRHEVGGVWFDNRYPGAACDVPSHLYSFSFAPYDWSRFFAGSREIHAYLNRVADEFGIRAHIRFGLEVTEARFDQASGEWEAEVVTAAGGREALRANILVSGVGAFNKPRIPAVPGLDQFEGPSVHTARYPDAGLDLAGRHVILVGNGASAMQVAPAIVDQVASLTIVQRTPQWVAPFPKFGQAIPGPLRRLLAEVPLYRRWYRLRLSWAFNDKLYEALQIDPAWDGAGRSINAINDSHRKGLTAYIKSELGSAQHLLPAVLPTYPPFGKRMLLDNGWFRALARSHVRNVVGGVTEVLPHAVITSDGAEHPADVIIWATGFDVVNFLAPMKVVGLGGRILHDDWHGDDARAYLGTVVPGYPNFFCLYGPNTQFGHGGSLITVLERQMHYVMSLLRHMFARKIERVDVRRDVHDAYNVRVDDAHAGLVWAYPGVESYYKNSKGRIVVNNPFRILEVWRMTKSANMEDFHCIGRGG